MNQQQNQSVREAAARLLTSRALSAQQLRDKLLDKKYSPDIVEETVLWMQEHSMIDDCAYAAMITRHYQTKGYGIKRIQQELRRRGISQEDTKTALLSFEPDKQQMLRLLKKYIRGTVLAPEQIRRGAAALARRGFLWSEIQEALRLYQEEHQIEAEILD